MPKFIVLAMFLDQEGGGKSKATQSTKVTANVPFLQWKEGYQVAPKNNREAVFTIKRITSTAGPAMTYQSVVDLTNEPGEEERTLRGSTLQSGYVFIGHGSVVEDERKDTTKPIGVNTDKIRNFYPRKDGRPGCRIMLDAAVNYAVADTFEDVLAKVNAPDYEVTIGPDGMAHNIIVNGDPDDDTDRS